MYIYIYIYIYHSTRARVNPSGGWGINPNPKVFPPSSQALQFRQSALTSYTTHPGYNPRSQCRPSPRVVSPCERATHISQI